MGCRVCPASKGVGFFKDILVRNRVSISVILVSYWVWFLHSSLELFAKTCNTYSISVNSIQSFTIQSETIVHKAGDPGSSNILK